MFQNLLVWERRWLIASGALFVLALGWTIWKYPSEGQFRERWAQTTKAEMATYPDVAKEINEQCAKESEHRDPVVKAARFQTCWDKNRKFHEVAVRSKANRMDELKVEFERQLNVALPRRQVTVVLRGLSIWLVPTLLFYLGGMFMVWRRKDFSMKWITGH